MAKTYEFRSHEVRGEYGSENRPVITQCHHLAKRICCKTGNLCPIMQCMEEAWLTGILQRFSGSMNDDKCGFLNGKTVK